MLEGLWLRYATLQNLIPSVPWIAPDALHTGTIQGKEGIKFCHLATLVGAGRGRDEGAGGLLMGRFGRWGLYQSTRRPPSGHSVYSVLSCRPDK